MTDPAAPQEVPQRDWMHRAACREEDPELFFPIGNRGPALVQIDQAKAVCKRCPARAECLLWALATNQESGVWGGLGEGELRAVRRRAARARHKPTDTDNTKKPVRQGQSRSRSTPAAALAGA